MKLTTVISSVNSNPDYYNFLPYQILFWNKFNIKFICIYVGEFIPKELEQYKEHIILWNKNKDLHSAYVAQNIRIFYAGLIDLPDDELIMLTDMDMLPCSKNYYTDNLEKYTKEDFIYYRYIDMTDKHVYLCYNAAHPSLWGEIFDIKSVEDIENQLNLNYIKGYNGIPGDHNGSVGWCADQDLLTLKLLKYKKLNILNRPIKRLEINDYNKYLQNENNNFLHLYDDVHFHRSFSENKQRIEHASIQLYNFISGYDFYKLCKWSVCPRYPIKFEPNLIQLNDFVFLNLDCFEQFIQMLKTNSPAHKFVLLTHNSDQKFTKQYLATIRPYISHIYAINCGFQDSLLTPIPLGFVDSKYKPHYKFEEIGNKKLEKTIKCYMNFAINTNPIKRQECYNTFVDKDWVTKESNIPPEDFYTQVARSKYILSPEGTGIDCHRIYESIYLGAIPVLKTSELDYFYEKLPVLIVKSWNEITQEYLDDNYLNLKTKLDQWILTNPTWTEAKFWIKEKNSCSSCGFQCGNLKCGKCGSVYYCNRSCQVAHWKIHKNECKSQNYTYVIYSHSSYSDILNIQNEYIKNITEQKILLIDKIDPDIKYNFDKIIYYDDKLNYTKRLYNCLKQLTNVKYIIFIHDNDILVKKSDVDLNKLIEIMNTNNIDRLDLQDKRDSNKKIKFSDEINLIKNEDIKYYIYNVNPCIYRLEKLIKLCNKFDYSYRDIEEYIQTYTLENLNTYYLNSNKKINGGYFVVTNIFVYLHITHSGYLMPANIHENHLDPFLQAHYEQILSKYKLNRNMRIKLH